MSKKRNVGKYTAAGVITALMGGAVVQGYRDIGTTPSPNDMERVRKIAIVAAGLTALTWLATSL